MSRSRQSCWRASLVFCLGLFLHCGEARVHTEAQSGPLYRVAGSPLSISCNVTGFARADSRQEFEFRIRKPSKPFFDINIISTSDKNFGYAVYSRRVRSGDITLTHVSPTSVIFEIKNLQKDDEGEFECTVINSETVYDGTYSAKTAVKVIDNSLSVSSPASTSVSYNEGDALTLTCQASSNTVQHTHLSLAWYLHRNGEDNAQPIISLDRDFTLSPGRGFEGRYQAGLIQLDKMGEATYKLKMTQLKPSDQGRIYCKGHEWIQDPDRSWYPIAHKAAEETTLNIKARVVVPDTSSLVVRIAAQPTTLQEGQELSLSCSINTQNLQERFFSVAWLRGNVELARIGPTGILSVGPEYSVRAKEGELRAARIGDRDYSLILQPVRTEEEGEYICRVWPQDRGQDGAFTQGAAQDSSSQLVNILATESGISLEMQNSVSVNEGDTLKLTCKVQGVTGQLSVTWQHKAASTSAATFTTVISLSQEGVMEKALEFMSRKVKATRPAADTFTLELDEVRPSDAGVYQCAVSEWKINSKTSSQSQMTTVTVAPADSFVKVYLISRNNIVKVGEDVELICRVQGTSLPITLTWSLQRDASTLDNILTLYSDGGISWSGDSHGYQLKVQRKQNEVLHYLLINGASQREAGSYQCSVSVFLENVNKKLPPSNQLAVNVQNPVSMLSLTSTPAFTSNINTDIQIKCSVTSKSSASSRYAVTWLLQQQAENKTILNSDRDALITFGPQVETSHRQRISMRRTKGPSFELSIRQAQISDQGSYICEVVEWLQHPRVDWYQLSPVSETIELTLIEPANDLRLDKTEQSVTVAEGDEVELKCNIISGTSSPSIFFKVTWFYTGHDSSVTSPLVELDHTGLLSYPEKEGLQGRLRLSRPTQKSFNLEIQRALERDNGTYKCRVEQYQLDQEGHWQQKASESTDPITLTVNVPANDLRLDKTEQSVTVAEGDEVELKCNIISGTSSPSIFFKVTWFYTGHDSSVTSPLVELDHMGLLSYPEKQGLRDLQGRLRLSRPTQKSFNLGIQRAHEGDNGTYKCRVEQYQLDQEGHWQQKASESTDPITLTVNVPEKKLSIVTKEGEFNVSTSQEFTIPCSITKQSSSESQFQVMWFWQKETESEQLPVFAAYRNSTLQDRSGKGDRLRFSHPVPNQFSLTVLKPRQEDSGLYFCEVEEWLPSLFHGWRKAGVEKSGYLTVNVNEGDAGAVSELECKSGTLIGIIVALVILTLVVLIILGLKMCPSKGGKKSEPSLWAEQHALNTKPSAED